MQAAVRTAMVIFHMPLSASASTPRRTRCLRQAVNALALPRCCTAIRQWIFLIVPVGIAHPVVICLRFVQRCPCLRCTIKIIQTGVKEVVYNLSYKV